MSVRHSRRLVVVGGGLAGLAAAVTAQRAGLPTCLIEQRPSLRGPRQLLAAVASSGIEVWVDTAAWGLWGRELALCGPQGPSSVLAFDQLVVGTGAFERPVAFPGWTLPGVMTASGAVGLLEQGVVPGQRLLVAGYSSWITDATAALRRHGVEPVAVLDASARGGRLVVRAEGEDRLQRVVTARLNADWYVRPGSEQALEVDALVMAFGAIPEDRLLRLAGCEHSGSAFIDPRTTHDAWQRTSVPGVLVAGDAGGIVGAEAALEQGRLAGLAAAVDAGCLSLAQAERRARPVRRRLQRRRDTEQAPEGSGTGS